MTVLDFVRYHKNLKGTKIGCREGDCGACTILVGELVGSEVKYRTMTSCLMPLANASAKHIVTVEGINLSDGSLTPVQQAMLDESGTQCGFCTVGFVISLTGFCIDDTAKTPEMAISAIDGNICRCTGYKSIERAACSVRRQLVEGGQFVPSYFDNISSRLALLQRDSERPSTNGQLIVGGGTDVYVQKPDAIAESDAAHLFYEEGLRGIREAGDHIEIGASATVTDLLVSPAMQAIFPDLYKHLKLVSSTPIRNMATLAGNFVNASPIGDMTVWFLALDAEITLSSLPYEGGVAATSVDGVVLSRAMKLKELYLGYKQLAKQPEEIITTIRFKKPSGDFRFNFEKVSKRTYLDISTANTAISLQLDDKTIRDANVAAGGVAPIPLYLKQTSEFLRGKEINEETVTAANEIMQSEISPISDVRGTEKYKRLLLRQLFRAHFVELFATEITEHTE